jgi:hypothetical protein
MIIGTHYTNKTTFLQGWRAGYGSTPILLQPQGGNVGIGTSNPTLAKLQIVGNLWIGSEGIGYSVHPNSKIEAFGSTQTETSIGLWQTGIASSLIGSRSGDSNFYLTNTYDGSSLGTASKSITLMPNGNVGIGTTAPVAGLHVTKTYNYNGNNIAAILGDNYNDWKYFGGITAGKIRGSNEGYLVVESNPNGSSDKCLYLNVSSSGNVIIATGGGNVGIGTTNPGNYKLAVEGTIGAREVKVTTSAWADFVFHPTYKLRTLGELEQFIKTNNHLPEIPTESEVKEKGVGLGEMNAKLLQKVEELTLYLIESEKKRVALEGRVRDLETKITK